MEFEVHTGEPGTIGSTDRYKSEDARYEILSGGVLLIVEGTQKDVPRANPVDRDPRPG